MQRVDEIIGNQKKSEKNKKYSLIRYKKLIKLYFLLIITKINFFQKRLAFFGNACYNT